jgi:hypothetical protein
MADQQLTEHDPEPEVVDGVVVREAAPIERRHGAPVSVQAAAVAGASVVAGVTAVALVRGALRLTRGPRPLRIGSRRGGRGRLDVIATRTFLVDVHLVDRR